MGSIGKQNDGLPAMGVDLDIGGDEEDVQRSGSNTWKGPGMVEDRGDWVAGDEMEKTVLNLGDISGVGCFCCKRCATSIGWAICWA
jgi:hypothetical protein